MFINWKDCPSTGSLTRVQKLAGLSGIEALSKLGSFYQIE